MAEAEPFPFHELPNIETNSYGLFPVYLPDPREAVLLRDLDAGMLTCPQCNSQLTGGKYVNMVYSGVEVVCIECGFREF